MRLHNCICIILLSSIIAGISGTFVQDFIEEYKETTKLHEKLARLISEELVNALRTRASLEGTSVRTPIFPGIEDPLPVKDTEIEIPTELADLVNGTLGIFYTDVHGLSAAEYTLNVVPILLPLPIKVRVKLDAAIPSLVVNGEHEAVLDFLGGLAGYEGFGPFELSLQAGSAGINVNASAKLSDGSISVTGFTIDLGFNSLSINMTESYWNGEPIDWESVNTDIREGFDKYWPIIKNNVEPLIPRILNMLLADCKLIDFINEDFSCLGLPTPATDPPVTGGEDITTPEGIEETTTPEPPVTVTTTTEPPVTVTTTAEPPVTVTTSGSPEPETTSSAPKVTGVSGILLLAAALLL